MTTGGGRVCGPLNSHPWLLNNLGRQHLEQLVFLLEVFLEAEVMHKNVS